MPGKRDEHGLQLHRDGIVGQAQRRGRRSSPALSSTPAATRSSPNTRAARAAPLWDAGGRGRPVRERFGTSPPRYFQVLECTARLGGSPGVCPVAINHLCRVREDNRRKYW
ncbi:DUF3263 domain-containing protein [Streptomyces avermitilis]|uniref:DUF3263 domain-containing protein n=1 Tax=Streptomyces avermitilis TaxID=33903 RepID=UPI0033B8F356